MKKIFTVLFFALALTACKDEFLDVKPNDALVVPTTLKDFQALLDNEEFMNGYRNYGPNSGLLFAGSDEYYILDSYYNNSPSQHVRNAYTWKNENLFAGLTVYNDWASPYRTVYYANVVLDGLKNIAESPANSLEYNNIKGSALFYRAFAFYQLAQVFAQPYNEATAASDLGIPLRLEADISEKSNRSSVLETYNQIASDLQAALPLLPDKPLFNTRPSKPSVYALFARMYLGMEKYDLALQNAQSCLDLKSELLDYNTLVASATQPMPTPITNNEVIFSGSIELTPLGNTLLNFNNAFIDNSLYAMYANNDLRKTVCYRTGTQAGTMIIKGSYVKLGIPFGGLATDEVYLVKAECLARKGNASGSMDALNMLLKARWKTGTFVPLTASSADDALLQVLTERRKELVMRGTRWTDLKRLNKDARFAKTINRIVNGQTIALPPGDPRYTWQIPDIVINLTGMQQNPR